MAFALGSPFLKAALFSISATFALAAPVDDAQAKIRHHAAKSTAKQKKASFDPANPVGTSVVINAETGQVIKAEGMDLCDECDVPRPPASMTKLVTAMVVFDAIRAGKLSYDTVTPLVATPNEDRNYGFGLHRNYGFRINTPMTIDNSLSALAVTSAADAARTLEKAVCEEEGCLTPLMNAKIDTFLPKGHITHYTNPHGMPDPDQVTTAREQALILKHMIDDYPSEYRYFGQLGYKIGKRYMKGHMPLLNTYNNRSKFSLYSCLMEGGKTGFFDAAGSNIVASAVCDGHRVIAVKMGAGSAGSRDAQVTILFDKGLKALKDTPVTVPGSLKPHRPGIIRPEPEQEREPDNQTQPATISRSLPDMELARNAVTPAPH